MVSATVVAVAKIIVFFLICKFVIIILFKFLKLHMEFGFVAEGSGVTEDAGT